MTDQVLRGIAGLPACHSHVRWRAGVLECGSALPLFGRRARRPQAPGPGRGSSASPVCSSARTGRFPGNPSRTSFNPCNPCNRCNLCNSCNLFEPLVAAQPRFWGPDLISAPFLPHFCLKQLMPTGKIQFPVLFGSLWFTLVPFGSLAGRACCPSAPPVRPSSVSIQGTRGQISRFGQIR